MPELPEVEVVKKSLKSSINNSIIRKERISKVAEFNVALYNIGNKKNNKIEIEKKIYDIIKISDTDVFIETF